MLNIFKKKIFILSFGVLFISGFFILSAFLVLDNNILNKILTKINEKFFIASLNINYAKEDTSNKIDFYILKNKELQEELDNIKKELDIANDKLKDFINKKDIKTKNNKENEDLFLNEELIKKEDKIENLKEDIIYPKVLISEVQITGDGDSKKEFIELYNPNSYEVDLTGWHLQRKTASGSAWSIFISEDLFLNKKINSKGYFLIVREGYYLNLADIFTKNPITDDNSFILKDPNGDISDKLGFGLSQDYETASTQNPATGQSIGRKVLPDKTEQDTDNNFNDFELQNPTPKAQNITYASFVPAIISSGGGGGGSGSTKTVYPKILISEVQINPIEQRFIELYNPNSYEVDLTGWYLQRKTQSSDSWSSFVSSTNFESKIISPGDYFIISREIIDSNILLSITISENNSFILKDPNGDISDKLGLGLSQDYETLATVNPEENKSIGRKVLPDKTEQDTDNNFNDFELQNPTPKAQNITYTELLPITDIDSPQVVFNIDSTQNNINFIINFNITDVAENILPSGIKNYIFRWQEEGKDWQEDSLVEVSESPISADFTKDFLGEEGKTYNFQIKAENIAGNISDWLPEVPATTTINVSVILKSILINEVQIEGDSVKDDWVELYNPNDFEVDINSWSIQRASKTGTIYKKNFDTDAKISANGYFLIVRDDASQQFLDIADMTCSALQLSSDSTVYLVKSQSEILGKNDFNIIDKVGFRDAYDYELNPAQIPIKNQSITRNDGVDINDNSIDFIISEIPTPKAGP